MYESREIIAYEAEAIGYKNKTRFDRVALKPRQYVCCNSLEEENAFIDKIKAQLQPESPKSKIMVYLTTRSKGE